MNRHTVITSIATVAIIAPFAYSALNIYAAGQLQYQWSEPEVFSYFVMSNSGSVEFCNPTMAWADIKSFEVGIYYDVNELGTFKSGPVSMGPSSSATSHGTFVSDEFVSVQHVFMTLDFEFDGGDIRMDPTKMHILVTAETPILGFIPYATSSQFTGFDFDKIMRGDGFGC